MNSLEILYSYQRIDHLPPPAANDLALITPLNIRYVYRNNYYTLRHKYYCIVVSLNDL